MIAAASVGAALGLKPFLDCLGGRIQVIGTPAAAGGGGKVRLAEAGVFDGIDVAMMFHPWNITAPCATSLARVKVEVEFRGKPAHSFMHQERGVDALAATLQFFNGVNALREHLRPYHVMVHGIITHGGDFAVTVPDRSASVFFVMAPHIEEARDVYEKVQQCARGASVMTGTSLEFRNYGEYHEFIPSQTLAAAFGANLELLSVGIDELALYDGIMCALDIGDVSIRVPAIHPYICLGKDLTWHTPEVAEATVSDEGHEVLLNAAKALALTAMDIYTKPALLDKARKEFSHLAGGSCE
jgi:metal-dependent amidase/aminoacylase/carboxypeptidase family protein